MLLGDVRISERGRVPLLGRKPTKFGLLVNVRPSVLPKGLAKDPSEAFGRVGVITDTAPLSVALGGADLAYTDVKAIATGLAVDDVVSVLQFGNDLLILGKIV